MMHGGSVSIHHLKGLLSPGTWQLQPKLVRADSGATSSRIFVFPSSQTGATVVAPVPLHWSEPVRGDRIARQLVASELSRNPEDSTTQYSHLQEIRQFPDRCDCSPARA